MFEAKVSRQAGRTVVYGGAQITDTAGPPLPAAGAITQLCLLVIPSDVTDGHGAASRAPNAPDVLAV